MGGFRETAQTFDVSKCWAVIAASYVQTAFELRSGVPLVCAAVDGTIIDLARFEDYESWYRRKGFNLQAIVDPSQRFMSFDMRPGSWSDKRFGPHQTLVNISMIFFHQEDS
ncbi:hypothetical protein PHMEG_00079 [Phytophthora megakarya]|uniref:DDE Tnp4 domain-containing protein n=1 Tax=Phytophthora megakarya TaxID=4795 RepID=A0A225X401_9STRA|nr:hypothetical protein PHMEG_00079 [Phytophthora megakarya]